MISEFKDHIESIINANAPEMVWDSRLVAAPQFKHEVSRRVAGFRDTTLSIIRRAVFDNLDTLRKNPNALS